MLTVVYFERWSGRLANRLNLNAVGSTPIIPDLPSARDSVARPYLFREYRRQAWLGWQQTGPPGQAVVVVPPGPTWAPTRQWSRWRPQPWLGWAEGGDQVQISAAIWTSIRQWQRWRAQPQIGWAQATDTDTLGVGAMSQLPLRGFLLRGYAPQPTLGWTTGDAFGLVTQASTYVPPIARRPAMFLTRFPINPYTSSGPSDGAPTPGGETHRDERRRWLWHRSSSS